MQLPNLNLALSSDTAITQGRMGDTKSGAVGGSIMGSTGSNNTMIIVAAVAVVVLVLMLRK